MKIIISELHWNKILEEDRLQTNMISEQSIVDDNRTLIILQNAINDLVQKKEKELLDKTTFKMYNKGQEVFLKLGQKTYQVPLVAQGVYAVVLPPKTSLAFGGSPLSELLPEIEKLPEYKALAEKYPEIMNQVQNNLIRGVLYTDDQNQGQVKLTVVRRPKDLKDLNTVVKFGTDYPLGEFLERNKMVYVFKNGLYGIVESGGLMYNLASMPIKLNNQQLPQNSPVTAVAPIQIKMPILYDLFNFDSVEFKDPNATNQQLTKFIQEIKSYITTYGQPFIQHMKTQNPTVVGYSSIDGDPNQAMTGGYKPCATGAIRSQYDKCLSLERAKKIADILNQALPELGNAFKAHGMGETTQWGPGWTQEKPTVPEQTAANRRYVLSPIKSFVAGQSQQPQQVNQVQQQPKA